MKGNIGYGSNNRPEYVLIGRAPYTGKPTKLKKDKVPKFSHIESLEDLRKRPLPLGTGLKFGGDSGIRTPDLWIMSPSLYPTELTRRTYDCIKISLI